MCAHQPLGLRRVALRDRVHIGFMLAVGLWHGGLLGVPDSVFGQWLLGIGIFNLIAGYVSAIALGTVAAARRGRLRLAAHALMMPVYWLGISFAAYRALWQLVFAPYYWEKTEHVGRPHDNTSFGETRIFTFSSLLSISSRKPFPTRSSSAIRPVMNWVASTFLSCSRPMVAGWSPQ